MVLFLKICIGILITFIVISMQMYGQLKIKGEVNDYRVALPGASVFVLEPLYIAVTEANGRDSIIIPSPAADINVDVQFLGYRKQPQSITHREGAVELNFFLLYRPA